MTARLLVQKLGYSGQQALASQIEEAAKEIGRDPDEIHFSTAQSTASGGQFGHYAALLIWRD